MKNCKKYKNSCGCKITLPVECIRWYGESTTFLPIKTNENLESILLKIEKYLQDIQIGQVVLENVGGQEELYVGISTGGSHQFRTLEAGENISIVKNAETLIISSEYDIPVHNTLQGLQGGTNGQYYHLTQSQYESLGTIPNLQQVTSVGASTNRTITVSQNGGQLRLWGINNTGWDYYESSGNYQVACGTSNIFSGWRNTRPSGSLNYVSMDVSKEGLEYSFPATGSNINSNRIISSSIIGGNSYTQTLQAKTGILAHLSDIPALQNLQSVMNTGNTSTIGGIIGTVRIDQDNFQSIQFSKGGVTGKLGTGIEVTRDTTPPGEEQRPQSVGFIRTTGNTNMNSWGVLFRYPGAANWINLYPQNKNDNDTKNVMIQNKTGTLALLSDIPIPTSGSTSVPIVGSEFQRAALTGDITSPSNSNSTTISNSAVSNAKLANMSADTIKGRISTTGAPQDLTVSQVRSIIGVGQRIVHELDSFTLPSMTTPPSQNSFAPIELFSICPTIQSGFLDWEITWTNGGINYKLSSLGDYNIQLIYPSGSGCVSISGQTRSESTYVVNKLTNAPKLTLYY